MWVANTMQNLAGQRLGLSVAMIGLFSSTGWNALGLQPLLIVNVYDAMPVYLHVGIGFYVISKSLIRCLVPHLLCPYGLPILQQVVALTRFGSTKVSTSRCLADR